MDPVFIRFIDAPATRAPHASEEEGDEGDEEGGEGSIAGKESPALQQMEKAAKQLAETIGEQCFYFEYYSAEEAGLFPAAVRELEKSQEKALPLVLVNDQVLACGRVPTHAELLKFVCKQRTGMVAASTTRKNPTGTKKVAPKKLPAGRARKKA